jgi:hypothetical protein
MIPQLPERNLLVGGVPVEVFSYRVSTVDTAHFARVFRDGLYTDKMLAFIREYSSNAVDAHVEAGIPDRPIKVTWPTIWDPTFRVRDYGRGLSLEQIRDVFTVLGVSTKREDNSQIGAYGFGCKAGHAYSDTFGIVSHHGGKRYECLSVIDESNVGQILIMDVSDSDETGLEVSVPIKNEDLKRFFNTYSQFYQYWDVQPESNLELPKAEFMVRWDHGGFLNGKAETVTVVVGGIAYRYGQDKGHSHVGRPAVVFLPIGSVTFPASREEIEKTPQNKKVIEAALNRLNEAANEWATQELNAVPAGWAREALRRQKFWWTGRQAFRVPYKSGTYHIIERVAGRYEDKATLTRSIRRDVISDTVRVNTKGVLVIDRPVYQNYVEMSDWNVAVVTGNRQSAKELIEQIQADFEAAGLAGVPIKRLTEIAPTSKRTKVYISDEIEPQVITPAKKEPSIRVTYVTGIGQNRVESEQRQRILATDWLLDFQALKDKFKNWTEQLGTWFLYHGMENPRLLLYEQPLPDTYKDRVVSVEKFDAELRRIEALVLEECKKRVGRAKISGNDWGRYHWKAAVQQLGLGEDHDLSRLVDLHFSYSRHLRSDHPSFNKTTINALLKDNEYEALVERVLHKYPLLCYASGKEEAEVYLKAMDAWHRSSE